MKEFVEILTNLYCGNINITNQEYGSKNLQSKGSVNHSASQLNLKREVSGNISELQANNSNHMQRGNSFISRY